MSNWQLWELPVQAQVFVATVATAGFLAIVVSASQFTLDSIDVGTWALLLGCAVLSAEVSRRIGEPTGVFKDLAAAWTVPMALLLQPVYVLVACLLLRLHAQWRIRRSVPHRLLFSASSVGLAHVLGGTIFRSLAPEGDRLTQWSHPHLAVPALALACGVLISLFNSTLVAAAVALTDPERSFFSLMSGFEARMLDCVEITSGIVVSVVRLVNPFLIPVVLPPILILQRSLMHDQLQSQARLDAKTGLLNSGTWNREAEREILAAGRRQSAAAVVLIDLDHFKRVNDTYGHLVGDQVLRAVAGVVTDQVRRSDLAGRFGGEELVLLLPDTGPARARVVTERLHQQIGALVVDPDAHAVGRRDPIRVTASIGVAMLGQDGNDVTELLAAADAALYRAKALGRNRTCLASEVRA